jgi:hypothetical protein
LLNELLLDELLLNEALVIELLLVHSFLHSLSMHRMTKVVVDVLTLLMNMSTQTVVSADRLDWGFTRARPAALVTSRRIPMASKPRPTMRRRRQRHIPITISAHERRANRMDECCVSTCHNLFGFRNVRVFEVRVVMKLGKSSETMIVSQQAVNVSNA